MEKPKKHWMLYLDKVEDLKDYDLCKAKELSRTDKVATLEIVGVFGNRKELPHNKIIEVPLEHLKLGYQTKEHTLYFRHCIKSINTKYLKNNEFWYLNAVFGYEKSLKVINENNGILDDGVIEEIARQSTMMYDVLLTKSGALLTFENNNTLMKNPVVLEKITSLDALKYYGIVDMEEVHEKTCVYVDRSGAIERARDKKIKDILND